MPVRFFQRRYPSANSVLLEGPDSVLIDTGFGTDLPDLCEWLGGRPPARIANTHFHTDHVGGNHALQARFACRILAGRAEAALVNRADPDACERTWLAQPIDLYTVDQTLTEGDVIDTGGSRWSVLATPGHTPGHLSFYDPAERTIILGDALHHADLGWLDPRDPAAIDRTEATLARIAGLDAHVGFSGHGPALTDIPAALVRAKKRLDTWRRDPEQVGWHAMKRIFTHALMLTDGLAEPNLLPALHALPWFRDHARLVFRTDESTLAQALLQEMLRAGAARWRDGRLKPTADYRPVTRR